MMVERIKLLLHDLEGIQHVGNARNVASAWYLIEEYKPDVMILDIKLEDHMPGQNGLTLLSLVRNHYPQTTVIMLTNLSMPEYRDNCMRLGADYFFDKSEDFEKIPETLYNIIHARKGQAPLFIL